MTCRGFVLTLICGVLVLCVLAGPSFALVYIGGLDHTTEPDADPGWDNVGMMSLASGVYLGDGWVLTAYHVYQHNPVGDRYIDLDQRYYEIPGTVRRLEYSPSNDADLAIFRINGNPALPLIDIIDTSPLSREITVIAGGYSRVGGQVDFENGYVGFETDPVRQKRWGKNITDEYVSIIGGYGFGVTVGFKTGFELPGIEDDECQLVDRDSGGGAFVADPSDGSWQLGGIALTVDAPSDYTGPDPTRNAVYGNSSVYADLANYRTQIEAIRMTRLPGDADRDGDVDITDYGIFQTTLGQTGSNLQADFNDDGIVNLHDFAIIRGYFGMVSGNGVPEPGTPPVQGVPEPVTIVLLAGAIPLLLRSRRRR
jgi:hypothetical protein